jgi:hypothetical protein
MRRETCWRGARIQRKRELEDPILRGAVLANPCLRREPLSLDYWTHLFAASSTSVRELWNRMIISAAASPPHRADINLKSPTMGGYGNVGLMTCQRQLAANAAEAAEITGSVTATATRSVFPHHGRG